MKRMLPLLLAGKKCSATIVAASYALNVSSGQA